jgi:predicted deacetylase
VNTPGSDGGPVLVVSVHDVSPATATQTARWCEDLDALGIPASLLVIPGPWRGSSLADAPDYARVLAGRGARGDEISLHGWAHTAGPEGTWAHRTVGRAVARGAAEFAALDAAEAERRLRDGQDTTAGLGLELTGFTPPGWLASPGTVEALRRQGFRYFTSHLGVHDLGRRRTYRALALSHRPGGFGEGFGAALMRAWARRGAVRGALVRVALHPDDLRRPRLRDTTLRAIESVLAVGGRATTYGDLVAGA